MKVLSLDTSARTATVAIVEDGKIISEYSVVTNTHSTTLLPMIESAMDYSGIKANDIDLYAVSVGPGSFTGIRIGVSTIKGLAFVNNTPCVGVSALEAMAENLRGIEGIIVPAIDARRDMVYTAIFKSDKVGNLTRITDDSQIQYPSFSIFWENIVPTASISQATHMISLCLVTVCHQILQPHLKSFVLSRRQE